MSGLESIARRYAQALFEIGQETHSLESMVDQTRTLAQAYADNTELRAVIDSPLVLETQREAVLGELGARLGLSDSVCNTARLLSRRRRMSLLPLVAEALSHMSDAAAGVIRASVVSAQPLSDDYVSRMQQQLERMSGSKVIVDCQVDPSLIGGVTTRLGDTLIDGSVRSRLQQLRDHLLST